MLMPRLDLTVISRVLIASVTAGAVVWGADRLRTREGIPEPQAASPARTSSAPTPAVPIDPSKWVITLAGLGPIAVNETIDRVREQLPWALETTEADIGAGRAVFQPTDGPGGLRIVSDDGRVVAVQVTGNYRTRSNVRVGDPVQSLYAKYPGQIRIRGAADSELRIYEFVPRDVGEQHMRVLFRTVSGTITAICAGRLPQVAEACVDYEGSGTAVAKQAVSEVLGIASSAVAWLDANRPDWRIATVSPAEIEECGSSLTTPPATAIGDFDGNGSTDSAAWIDTPGKVELMMFMTSQEPQRLEWGTSAAGTLLVTIPRGQRITDIGGQSIQLKEDALSVLRCGQSQYVFVKAGAFWNQYWISD